MRGSCSEGHYAVTGHKMLQTIGGALPRNGRHSSDVAVQGKQAGERLKRRRANSDEQHVNCLGQHDVSVAGARVRKAKVGEG